MDVGFEILLSSRTVAPCNGCESCSTTGQCILEDDLGQIYEEYAVVADKPGDIRQQPKRLHQARALGENVLRCAELLRPAGES